MTTLDEMLGDRSVVLFWPTFCRAKLSTRTQHRNRLIQRKFETVPQHGRIICIHQQPWLRIGLSKGRIRSLAQCHEALNH